MNKLNKYKEDIFKLYHLGIKIKEISKIYNCNVKTIHKLFKINNIVLTKNHKKYSINESFLDNIDTEEKAYFLGFMYADGYNNLERGFFNLELIDEEIVIKIAKLLNSSRPIMHRIKKDRKDTYRLSINSKILTKRLNDLGCYPNKTFKLTFPNNNQVPNNLIRHFIRGYFDGDGSINNGKKYHFSFVGTEYFIDKLQDVFSKELGFLKTKTSIRHPERNNNIRTLLKCGKIQCIRFGEWLYKDATIFLKRKKEIFDKSYFNCGRV
jgi:DNA-binding transcriptional regulator WhiA